jgi:hypothetical protein
MSEEESFKITDRRGRSTDAERTEPHPGPAQEASPPFTASPRVDSAGGATRRAAPEPGGPDLQSLFAMFASSALISLGEAADPLTGEARVDLDQAREAIDVLRLLRDKTNGNRTDQETQLLEGILYDLQMRFVRATEGQEPR